jgi:hypothetical protein
MGKDGGHGGYASYSRVREVERQRTSKRDGE